MVASPLALLSDTDAPRRRVGLTAEEATELLASTRRALRQPVALLSDVVGGVLVVLERGSDGLVHGETRYAGEVRGWSCTELSRGQLRELAAHARCLAKHGENGRKAGLPVYDSVGGGA